MPTVTTRVLKDRLSFYLHRVEAGERIVVLRDGRPIVAMIPAHSIPESDEDAILADLAARGIIDLPPTGTEVHSGGPVLTDDGGVSLSAMIAEDRG